MAAGEERSCAFVISKRGRRCRMQASSGSIYCGEHLIHDTQVSSTGRKRIACPLDPSHTVYQDVLQKHLKKCNASKKQLPSCYSHRINEGLSLESSDPSVDLSLSLSSCPPKHLQELIQRVELAYESHVTSIQQEFLAHPFMLDELSDPTNGESALKHLRQQASILSHLEKEGLLLFPQVSCYVEFGAGRGKMTQCIHKALHSKHDLSGDGVQYVLVDKASCRRKVDGAHRAARLKGATCHRLLMDIMHLDLNQVEALKGRGVVGVGKHVCGAATDLALRSLIRLLSSDNDMGTKVNEGVAGPSTQLCGVAMALCCHHRCCWSQLVGREFLSELGFTPQDFHLISHMTSWAVCGTRPPERGGEEEEDGFRRDRGRRWGYVPHANEGVGLKSKRLIDLARLSYLRENGLDARLVYYVDTTTSLENVLLLAKPHH